MRTKTNHNYPSQRFLNHFLCAGSSALILSIAHTFPQYWFISLFALIPFLWRTIKVSLVDSIILGVVLASCYTTVTYPGEILIAPLKFCFRFFLLNLVFVSLGAAVNILKGFIGFSPIFTATLWLPFEYILIHYAGLGNIFIFANNGSGFVIRVASLSGILMVSFSIVLINSLILKFIEYIGVKIIASDNDILIKSKNYYIHFKEIVIARYCCYSIDPRAPP
mgnify:CR=1 FL=1